MDWIQALQDYTATLVKAYGYIGIFAAMALTSSSILLPIPGYLTVIFASPFLNPYLVAIAAGSGAALGELTSYLLGLGGRKIIGNRGELETAKHIYSRYGAWSIFIFAATPLPFDIIGIICGALMIDLKLFFLMTLAGKITLYMVLAQTGTRAFEAIKEVAAGQLSASTAVLLLIAVASLAAPLIYWKATVKQRRVLLKSASSLRIDWMRINKGGQGNH
ncbi:MAG: VTT domain-containing protein [Candidatus Bathyarchaeia archaeon]